MTQAIIGVMNNNIIFICIIVVYIILSISDIELKIDMELVYIILSNPYTYILYKHFIKSTFQIYLKIQK